MKNKSVYLTLFLACWLLGNTAFAGTPPVFLSTTHPALSAPLNPGCDDLPAPGNFRVTGVGPTSISLAWDPVNLAASYFLEVYVANSPFLVSTHTLYGTSGTVNVPAGGTYDLYLAAVGEQCQEPSPFRADIPDVVVIIAELILDRMPPAGMQYLPGPRIEGCYKVPVIPGTSYWFDIVYEDPLDPYQYSTYQVDLLCKEGCSPQVTISRIGIPENMGGGGWSTYPWGYGVDPTTSTQGWGPPRLIHLERLQIKTEAQPQDIPLYMVTFTKTLNQFELCFCRMVSPEAPYSFRVYEAPSSNQLNYTVSYVCVGESNGGGGNSGQISGDSQTDDRSSGQEQTQPISFTVQNPFNDAIHIRSNYTGEEPVQFELFNLNGQLVTTQKVTTAQEYNLPTSKLPPGMYVLHIKAGSTYQTRKLVKMH